MDRRLYVPFLSVEDVDLLTQNRQAYIGLGRANQAILGGAFQADGLVCTPTTPASLSVNVNIKSLYVEAVIDTAPYGNLPADSNLITKQGVNFAATNLNFTPPATPGEAINYLIQSRIVTSDTDNETRQFHDNNGNEYDQPINQDRIDRVQFSIVAGTPAPINSQSTPAPDPGYCGCFVVTVENGQTEIESGDIARYTGSGAVIFLDEKLKDKISQTTADNRYPTKQQIQNNSLTYVTSGGSANAYTVALNPAVTAYSAGLEVKMVANFTNTGNATLNVNGLGAVNIFGIDGQALVGGEIRNDGTIYSLIHNNTNFILTNPSPRILIASVSLSGTVVIPGDNVPALFSFDSIEANDYSIWNNTDRRMILKKIGWWSITAYIQADDLDPGTAGFGVNIFKNGAAFRLVSGGDMTNGTVSNGSINIYSSAITDYIDMRINQDSGSNKNFTNAIFQARYIGL